MLDDDARKFLLGVFVESSEQMLLNKRPEEVLDATFTALAKHASPQAKMAVTSSLGMPGAPATGMPQAQGVPPGPPGGSAMGPGLGGPPGGGMPRKVVLWRPAPRRETERSTSLARRKRRIQMGRRG